MTHGHFGGGLLLLVPNDTACRLLVLVMDKRDKAEQATVSKSITVSTASPSFPQRWQL